MVWKPPLLWQPPAEKAELALVSATSTEVPNISDKHSPPQQFNRNYNNAVSNIQESLPAKVDVPLNTVDDAPAVLGYFGTCTFNKIF